ncbi:MAG: copper amine oxidase N-terminal domain-containing protein [Acidobacteriota bacterium]
MTNKSIVFVIAMILIVAMICPVAAAAKPTIYLNDKPTRIIPVTVKGSTYVPMRSIFELVGADVDWNEYTNTVTAMKGDKGIILTIGKTRAFIDEKPVVLDAPPRIIDRRTYVPLRFIAQALGIEIHWDGKYRIKLVDQAKLSAKSAGDLSGPSLEAYDLMMSCKYSGEAAGTGYVEYKDVPFVGTAITNWTTNSKGMVTYMSTSGSAPILGDYLTNVPVAKVNGIELVNADKKSITAFLKSCREVSVANGVITIKGAQAPDSTLSLLNIAGGHTIVYYKSKMRLNCKIHIKDGKVTQISDINMPGKILHTNSGQWISFTLIGKVVY